MESDRNSQESRPRWCYFTPVRFLGSLQLAMLLLGILILACGIGTLAESRFDTRIAKAYVYEAPWFEAWLLLLCLNLICAVLVRFPWKPHQTGFVITHAGIVVLLAGAMIGQFWGVEGMMTLFKGDKPLNYLLLDEKSVQIRVADTDKITSYSLDSHRLQGAQRIQEKFHVNGMKVSIGAYSDNLVQNTVYEKAVFGGSPAVKIRLENTQSGHALERWLWLGGNGMDRIPFGPGTVRLLPFRAQEAGKAFQAEFNSGETSPGAHPDNKERHYVFANMPSIKMARVLSGSASGIETGYEFIPQNSIRAKGTLKVALGGKTFEFDADAILGKQVNLGETGWILRNVKYFPDFRLEGKIPVSVTSEPRNPALVFDLTSAGSATAGNHLECAHQLKEEGPKPACCANHDSDRIAPVNSGIRIYYREEADITFSAHESGREITRQRLEAGKDFRTGLGNWTLALEKVIAKATVKHEVKPAPDSTPKAATASGVHVRIQADDKAAEGWVTLERPVHWNLKGKPVFLRFGYERYPLDFGVALENFEVERNEGTQRPAGFKSTVRFVDSSGNDVSGPQEIWMNHPALFPQVRGAGLLGTSYKFSQSSWSPENLDQTTLQVLRDPGWSLKWIGSLMVCLGIFTIFYLKPYPQFKRLNPL